MTWTKRFAWLLLLLGLLLIFAWGWRLARTARSLRGHLGQVVAMADAPTSVDPAAACGIVQDLRADVVALERDAGVLVRLAPALGWLPKVGGDLRAAPYLLAITDGLLESGALLCDALGPALDAFAGSGDGLSLQQVAGLLAARQLELEQAAQAIGRAETAWTRVDAAELSPWLGERVALLERGLPLAQAGVELLRMAPDLMGAYGPRTYLILALNEDELRPGGGFLTGVGEVRIEGGQLTSMVFRDSYDVDDFTMPYPYPPEPLYRYMGIDQWVFRDSNWSPDFPTAARQAIDLYRPGYPVTADGVVALDQQAVQQLVDALGPLMIEGAEQPLTGDTVISYMREAWAPEGGDFGGNWWNERKSFMGALAEALWGRVQEGQVDWLALAQAVLRLLEEKHLLVYLAQPDAAAALAAQGWDASLQAGPGDFLLVVDANLGYNKASTRVQESLTYELDLRASSPLATLTLVYTHTGTVDYPCQVEVRYDPVYEQMMDRCYWDYLRVYAAPGSQLVDATRLPVPGDYLWTGQAEWGDIDVYAAEEGPWQIFAAMAVIPPGTTQTRLFTWTLPVDIIHWQGGEGRYLLRVSKQPGTRGHHFTLRVRLPEGSVLLGAMPEATALAGEWVVFETSLERDLVFQLRFGEGER